MDDVIELTLGKILKRGRHQKQAVQAVGKEEK
jgi:hypothetical protein